MTAGRTRDLSLPASAVLAAALPILFLHVDYQPGFTVHAGSTSVHVVLSDLVLLAVGITALVAGIRHGFAPLRAGWPIWIGGGIFLADVVRRQLLPEALGIGLRGVDACRHRGEVRGVRVARALGAAARARATGRAVGGGLAARLVA